MNVTRSLDEFLCRFPDQDTMARFEPVLAQLLRAPGTLDGYQPFQGRPDKPVRVFRFRIGRQTYFGKQARDRSPGDRLKHYLGASSARRAVRASERLRALGVPCPRLVCVVEKRRGGLRRDWLWISEGIPRAWKLRQFLYRFGGQRRLRWELMRQIGRLLARLHRAGVYHSDLRSTNLLVQEHEANPSLYLVDVEAVRFCRTIPRRLRLRNFSVLNLTWAKPLTLSDRLRVFDAYADELRLARRQRRELLRDVVRVCLRSMHEYLAKPSNRPFQIPRHPTFPAQVRAITQALEPRLRQKGELAAQFPDPLEQ